MSGGMLSVGSDVVPVPAQGVDDPTPMLNMIVQIADCVPTACMIFGNSRLLLHGIVVTLHENGHTTHTKHTTRLLY